MEVAWSSKSLRTFKRLVSKNPQLRPLVEEALKLLAENPFNSSLRTHKLTGDLADVWSCSIDYNNRILFEFVKNPDTEETAILLLNIGSHDEVY